MIENIGHLWVNQVCYDETINSGNVSDASLWAYDLNWPYLRCSFDGQDILNV